MRSKRVLTVQDISCFGQCSLTVALPVLSATGIETAILPTAVLSTHTAGFKGFTFRDLSEDIPSIITHWKKEGLKFDGLYTGYLGSKADIDYVKEIAKSELLNGPIVIDPCFGDHGKLYGLFDEEYVKEVRSLCDGADYLLPNITEACYLLGIDYIERVDEEKAKELIQGLIKMGAKNVVLKGLSNGKGTIGVAVSNNGKVEFYFHEKLDKDYHGTGDVFASVFVGAYMNGKTPFEAVKIASNFVYECISATIGDDDHPYGVEFEPRLGDLIAMVAK